MILAHKIALVPNNVQRTHFAKAAGVARFAYNWALAEWNRRYDAGEKNISEAELRRALNAKKRTEFPWMLEVTKCAPQQAIKDLGVAFGRFFKKVSDRPTFKKKYRHDSFYVSNDQFTVRGRQIRVPNLGWVRMTEELRFGGKIMGATFSRTADRWYVAIQVEMPDTHPAHACENQAVGVDLGIKDLIILSDGTKYEGPKPHRALQRREARLNQALARKHGARKGEKKSRNKWTTFLTRSYGVIGIETLNVKGMEHRKNQAFALLDMGFYEFRRQMEYKSKLTGSRLHEAKVNFPSSKTCSSCGYKMAEMPVSVRQWTCPQCGAEHDRDVNAAINLKQHAVSSTVSACGELGAVRPSMKQEVNVNAA